MQFINTYISFKKNNYILDSPFVVLLANILFKTINLVTNNFDLKRRSTGENYLLQRTIAAVTK